MPSYRGDIINGPEFTPEARIPDPNRQIEAYRQSAATLNLIRAFATGGYADLERVHQWNMGFVKDSPQGHRYEEIADRIEETLGFMRACGITSENTPQLRATSFYTSHEALLLGYEQALTRKDSTSGDWYATSGHMIWIGDRTRQPDHAHVEYAEASKIRSASSAGPPWSPMDCCAIYILNPANEAGRLTLICRFGPDKVETHLPKLVRAVKKAGNRRVELRSHARQYDFRRQRLQDTAV